MGRHKTISDDAVLTIAREVFRHHGQSATTRAIAEEAGISEGVLYQRFGSKDDLFFAAMRPTTPDLDAILGPPDPPADAKAYVRKVTARMGRYFLEVIPLALHVMTHPSFDAAALARSGPHASAVLRDGLAARLARLAQRKCIGRRSPHAAARLLVSLAHDWALGSAISHHGGPGRERELLEMVDVVWAGLRGLLAGGESAP